MFACGYRRLGVRAGYVAISPADILPMFRRCGSGPRTCTLRRVRPLEAGEWVYITDPREGLVVEVADLLIRACEVHRFEGECDRNGPSGPGGGTSGRHDWDGMYLALIRRLHDHGVPVTQAAWIAEMQDWFARHSRSGDIPDERSIRRRVNPVWRMLREDA